jgi:hypothetical protein
VEVERAVVVVEVILEDGVVVVLVWVVCVNVWMEGVKGILRGFISLWESRKQVRKGKCELEVDSFM